MNTPHPTDEQLSAALDGHDTGAAAHTTSCDACQQRLALLRTVIDAVAAPPPIDEVRRERALAAALTTAPDDSIVLAPSRRTRWRLSPGLGAAIGAVAVLLIAVLVGPALTGGNSHKNEPVSVGLGGAKSGDELAGPAAIDGGDLGAISDSQKLAAIVGPALGAQFDADTPAAAGEQSSKSDAAPASTTTSAPASGGQGQVFAAQPPRLLRGGPFPCADVVAKDYSQGLGPLLYTATLTWQGKPAVVLAYALAQPTGTLDHRVFVMSRSGCTLLTALSL